MKHAGLGLIALCVLGLTIGAHQQTADGGYIIAGSTMSYTHGSGDVDFLVYRLDAAGNKLWRKNLGGEGYDEACMVIQAADGGFLVLGHSDSYTNGCRDFLAYKLDAAGNKLWRKNYGGEWTDHGYSVQQTADGGYILAGDSESYANGGWDFLLYRVDGSGAKLWRKNFGGSQSDTAIAAQQTTDGGFIVAGLTNSYGPTLGMWHDFLVYRLDAAGNKLWRKNYGGTYCDHAFSVQQTTDGGFIVAGDSENYTHGHCDLLVYKLDAAGTKQWRKNYGGGGEEFWGFIRQTADGGYVLAGYTESYVHDAMDPRDLIVYKLDAAGDKDWRRNFGGSAADGDFTFVCPTADGGYFLFGESWSYHAGIGDNTDFLCYKLDAAGNKLWRKNFGGSGDEYIEIWD